MFCETNHEPCCAPDANTVTIDPIQASIGQDAVEVVGDLLESHGLWPFTMQLGWTAAQFDFLMQQVRSELNDVQMRLYLPMWVAMPVAEIKLLIGVQSYCLRSQMMAFRLSCGGGGQTPCEVPGDNLRATWGGLDGSLSDHRPCRSPVSPIPAALP
jgi:hypothetical protein